MLSENVTPKMPVIPVTSSPFMVDSEERLRVLMQPGVMRALRAVSIDAFEVMRRKVFAEASMGAGFSNEYMKLAAQLIREINHDPLLLKISLTKIDQRLSGYEQRQMRNSPTPWNQLKTMLENPATDKEDWKSVFRVMAKAAQDQEKDALELVHRALRRGDSRIEVIAEFPKIFRSARGRGNESFQTALMSLASGVGSHTYDENSRTKTQEASMGQTVELISALRSIRIKESGDVLVQAALSERPIIRDAFLQVFGLTDVVKAINSDGRTALHEACMFTGDQTDARVRRLLGEGWDPLAKDKNHHTPLDHAITRQNNVNSVDALLKTGKYTEAEIDRIIERDKLSYLVIPDPQVKALLFSEKARMAIDAIGSPHLNYSSACAP